MFKLKINKSLCVAGALSALAMSINTALGLDVTDEDLGRWFVELDEISEEIQIIDPEAIRPIISQIYPYFINSDGDDLRASLFAICLGINSILLESLFPERRKELFKALKDDSIFANFIRNSSDEFWSSPDETYRLRAMGSEAEIHVVAMLLKHTHLVSQLDLLGNNIGASGAESLSEALQINSSLTQLGLGNNNIGASGASSLSEALKVNSSLTQLNLRDNSIGDSGAKSLSDAMESNITITELDIHRIYR